jgi:hypothetical protein
MSWLASYWTTRVILNCNVKFGPCWCGGSHKHQVSCNFDKVHLLVVLCLVGGSNKAMKGKEGNRSTIEVLRYNVNVFHNQFIDQCWLPKLYNNLLQETIVCWVPWWQGAHLDLTSNVSIVCAWEEGTCKSQPSDDFLNIGTKDATMVQLIHSSTLSFQRQPIPHLSKNLKWKMKNLLTLWRCIHGTSIYRLVLVLVSKNQLDLYNLAIILLWYPYYYI